MPQKEAPKDTAGPSTRLSKKAENLAEAHLKFLDTLLDHVNVIPQESIAMVFLEPLISFDPATQKFIQDPSKTTPRNIQALDWLIHISQKEKQGLFQLVGKQFVTKLGQWTKQIVRQNKD